MILTELNEGRMPLWRDLLEILPSMID